MEYLRFAILRARTSLLSWFLFTLGLVGLYLMAGENHHLLRLFFISDGVFAVATFFSMSRATRYLRGRRMDGDQRGLEDISYEWNREMAHFETYSPGMESLEASMPQVNVNGMPMVSGTSIDVTGKPFGTP